MFLMPIFFVIFLKSAEIRNFSSLSTFHESIDKEIGREGGGGAKGLRVVVLCHPENIVTYRDSSSRNR